MTWKNGFGKCYLIYQPMDEKTGPTFASFNATPAQITEKKIIRIIFTGRILFNIFFFTLQEHFVYGQTH